jgi:hypothetical protein
MTTVTRDIYVDSRRRTELSGNVYTMYLQDPIKLVTQVDLVSAVIPNTMYNITDSSICKINDNQVILNPGFYSACGICETLNCNQPYVCFDLVECEGKITVTSLIIPDGEEITSNLFTITEMTQEFKTITKLPENSTNNFMVSESVINMHPTGDFIFLEIEELRPPYAIDAVNISPETSTFSESFRKFATIPMDTTSGTMKIFKEMSDYKISVRYPNPIDRIDRLSVRWLDTNGNVLNFNGVEENSFILRFHFIKHELESKPFTLSEQGSEKNTTIFYFALAFILVLIILFI